MISENLKELLIDRSKDSKLNFKSLVDHLDSSKFEFIGSNLNGSCGLAVCGTAYIDINGLNNIDNKDIYFVLLHEYCHVLRIDKMGKNKMISHLSGDNFDDLFEHVITEEIMADRFACFYFFVLNKEYYSIYRTQQLYIKSNRLRYKPMIDSLHGRIKNEEDYDRLVDEIVLDWTNIKYSTPIWYEGVDLLVNGKIRTNFHRLQGEDDIYYGTLESNECIHEDLVSHWKEREKE